MKISDEEAKIRAWVELCLSSDRPIDGNILDFQALLGVIDEMTPRTPLTEAEFLTWLREAIPGQVDGNAGWVNVPTSLLMAAFDKWR